MTKRFGPVAIIALAAATSAVAQETGASGSELEAASVEEIVVTGYRRSIAESLAVKRNYTGVVDAILAEDIGQFPQSNVSEAIQRISGVQIRRDFAGAVGNEISIRGLPPEYTQTIINGRVAPTNDDERTFNFNILPAELFEAVEVYKSPTADQPEGGVGGTIAMRTIRPASLTENIAVVSLEGVYNEITETTRPRGSVVAGANWGRFGAAVGLGHAQFTAASQAYDTPRWTRRDFDVDGDGTDEFEDVFLMDLPRLIHQEQDVERTTFSSVLEFRPTDAFSIALDAFYVDNQRTEDRFTPIWFFRSGSGIQDIAVANGAVEFIAFDDVLLRSENFSRTNDTQTYSIGLGIERDLDDWILSADIGLAETEDEFTFFRYFADANAPAAYDIREDNDYFDIRTPLDLSDPDAYTMSEYERRLTLLNDRELSASFDARRPLDNGWELKLGANYRDRTKDRRRFRSRVRGISEPFAPVATVFRGFEPDSSVPGELRSFAIHDLDLAFQTYTSDLDPTANEEINNAYDVNEELLAGYAMASYADETWLFNVGARIIGTDISSAGFQLEESTGAFTPIRLNSSYTDVLPSASVRYTARENLYLRFAAARVMTRPALTDLAAYREIDDVSLTGSSGNPDLDPFRANQIDVSVEWYFSDDSLLAAGYFFKDVESFVGNVTTNQEIDGQIYAITQPVNRNNATIDGFELNYQQPFTFLPALLSNFGVIANFTYTDSSFEEVLDEGGSISYGLPQNSRTSYNLIAYYDDGRVSVRLAHNFRERFLREVPNPEDGLKYRDDVRQTDLSFRVNATDNLQIVADVLNLFDDRTEEFVFEERLTDGAFTVGRTVQFGVRAQF